MERFHKNTVRLIQKYYFTNNPEELILEDSKLLKVVKNYSHKDYLLTDIAQEFLSYFANKKFFFKGVSSQEEINFNVKKVLKRDIRGWENEYQITGLTPLGVAFTGHMIFFCDDRGWTYISYDTYLTLLGHTPFEGLNNLLLGKEIEKDILKKQKTKTQQWL